MAAGLSACKQTRSDSSNPDLIKAKALISQGNFTEAFATLNNALAEAPRDPNVHLNLGWLYLYTGDVPHAQKEVKTLEELAPDLAETYHLRGYLATIQAQRMPSEAVTAQEYRKAIQNYNESLHRDAENHQTYFDLASSLSAIGNQEEALDVLNRGFDKIPQTDLETQVNFQIASCAAEAKLQRYEEAIADCNQAREFTNSPTSKERIEEMINNMKLMNPSLRTEPAPDDSGHSDP